MVASGWGIHDVAKESPSGDINIKILDPIGLVVGHIRLHPEGTADGGVCAQLELRFANQSSALIAPEVGVDTSGHASGRTWVLVEMDARKSFNESMRFRIHIPGKPGHTGQDVGDTETSATVVRSARK